jgi:alpha-L-rhamnosidase
LGQKIIIDNLVKPIEIKNIIMNAKIQIVTLLIFLSSLAFGQSIEIDQLKTDHQTTPLGFDQMIPEFSWILQSSERQFIQTAYEILVSNDPKKLDLGKVDCWKSGKIISGNTFGIRYSGKPLQSFTRYFWKVRVWNKEGVVSKWSSSTWFETSMMKSTDWKAQWISDQRALPEKEEDFYKEIPNPLLRKKIKLKKEIRSARLYIAGLGYSIAYLNSLRVGDHMLDMPWTQFDKQVMYNTFDVTSLLHKGENVMGVMLGNGWYNPLPFKIFRTWNL